MLNVAQAAAEAHKEGGFIGIGGKPISDKEQAALDEISVLDEASAEARWLCWPTPRGRSR